MGELGGRVRVHRGRDEISLARARSFKCLDIHEVCTRRELKLVGSGMLGSTAQEDS